MNDEENVKFPRELTYFRINVLLSRAKHGMYIIGNSETSAGVEMWSHVIDMLKELGNMGDKLDLCCPRHTETPLQVKSPDDFSKISPEGGCDLHCDMRLECGHRCTTKCHSDMKHDSA